MMEIIGPLLAVSILFMPVIIHCSILRPLTVGDFVFLVFSWFIPMAIGSTIFLVTIKGPSGDILCLIGFFSACLFAWHDATKTKRNLEHKKRHFSDSPSGAGIENRPYEQKPSIQSKVDDVTKKLREASVAEKSGVRDVQRNRGPKYVGVFDANTEHGFSAQYTTSGVLKRNGYWHHGVFIGQVLTQHEANEFDGKNGTEIVVLLRYNYVMGLDGVADFGVIKRSRRIITNYSVDKLDGASWFKKNKCGHDAGLFFNGGKYIGFCEDQTYQTFSGEKFIGTQAPKKPHGYGTYWFPSGEKYQGNFVHGEFNGQGQFVWLNGGEWAGKFNNGKLQGFGALVLRQGDRFIGHWTGGLAFNAIKGTVLKLSHDCSKLFYGKFLDGKFISDGNQFEGKFFININTIKGDGIFRSADGFERQGSFFFRFFLKKENMQISIKFLDQSKYFGDFIFDGRTGRGMGAYEWPDGQKYKGEFRNGLMDGSGSYTFSDGTGYVGEFKDDKMHGQGTMTWTDGKQYVGQFKDGEIHEQDNMVLPNRKV